MSSLLKSRQDFLVSRRIYFLNHLTRCFIGVTYNSSEVQKYRCSEFEIVRIYNLVSFDHKRGSIVHPNDL